MTQSFDTGRDWGNGGVATSMPQRWFQVQRQMLYQNRSIS